MINDSALLHELPYDPQKAHEYYLRNRELKGRLKKSSEPPPTDRSGRSIPIKQPKKAVTAVGSKKTRTKTNQEEVEALKKRLAKLREVLKQLVEEAKARSGVKETDKEKADRNSKEKGKSPLNAKQKRAAQKRSKEYYEKHKDQSPDETIKELKGKILAIKEKIAAALEKAKKTSPATKSKARESDNKKQEGARQNGS